MNAFRLGVLIGFGKQAKDDDLSIIDWDNIDPDKDTMADDDWFAEQLGFDSVEEMDSYDALPDEKKRLWHGDRTKAEYDKWVKGEVKRTPDELVEDLIAVLKGAPDDQYVGTSFMDNKGAEKWLKKMRKIKWGPDSPIMHNIKGLGSDEFSNVLGWEMNHRYGLGPYDIPVDKSTTLMDYAGSLQQALQKAKKFEPVKTYKRPVAKP